MLRSPQEQERAHYERCRRKVVQPSHQRTRAALGVGQRVGGTARAWQGQGFSGEPVSEQNHLSQHLL